MTFTGSVEDRHEQQLLRELEQQESSTLRAQHEAVERWNRHHPRNYAYPGEGEGHAG